MTGVNSAQKRCSFLFYFILQYDHNKLTNFHHCPHIDASPPTWTGDDCSLSSRDLPSSIKDNFESGSVSPESWQLIQGGGVGSGCGQLSPHAHGDSLYFNGCKMRQAVTKPLDLTRARYRYSQNTNHTGFLGGFFAYSSHLNVSSEQVVQVLN